MSTERNEIDRQVLDIVDAMEDTDLGALQSVEIHGKVRKGNKRGPKPIEPVFLREVREAVNLTGYELSKITHTGASNINMIELGKINISIKVLKEICISMNVSADDILFGLKGRQGIIDTELAELRLFKFNIERIVNSGTFETK